MATDSTFRTRRLDSLQTYTDLRIEGTSHSSVNWDAVHISEGAKTTWGVQGNWGELNTGRFSTGTFVPSGVEVNLHSFSHVDDQLVGSAEYVYIDEPDTQPTIWLIGTYAEALNFPHYSAYVLNEGVGSYFGAEEQFTSFANRHQIETLLGLDGMRGLSRLTGAIENYSEEKVWPLSSISVRHEIDAEVENWEYIQVDLKFTTSFEAADGLLHELYPILDGQLNEEEETVRELLTRLVYFDIE